MISDFIDLIKEGYRLSANIGSLSLDRVRLTVFGYFRQVRKWSIRIFLAALIPLLALVPVMLFNPSLGWLSGLYLAYFILLVAAELILFAPMFFVWRGVKSTFPAVAGELESWADFVKNVIINGLSLAIFVTLVPVFRSPASLFLLLLIAACWLALPATSIGGFFKRIYPAVRDIQLILLLGLLVVHLILPRHMEQLIWAINKKIEIEILAPISQTEITSEWGDLQWFSNTGKPLVWYSASPDEGYKLWAAPGFDPMSGKELQPITDDRTRKEIVAYFASREREKISERALEEQKHQWKEQRSVEEQATKDLASYVARYIDVEETRESTNGLALAALVTTESAIINNRMTREIVNSLELKNAKSTVSLFKPAFVADGLFAEVFGGSSTALDKLDLPNHVRMLIFGRQTVTYSTSDSLKGVVTARMNLDLIAFPSSRRNQSINRTIVASGAGFNREDARSEAEERLINQVKAGEANVLLESALPRTQ